jgi:hypothetical protein
MKYILTLFTLFTSNSYANITGIFNSEFIRNGMECMIESNVSQKNINQITFRQWDELCEDKNGNSFESSLAAVMTYEKISEKRLKVTQGKDSMELEAKVLDFKRDNIHYNFEVDTEDGHLEINESYSLNNDALAFSSLYLLDGKEIINKSGIIQRKK